MKHVARPQALLGGLDVRREGGYVILPPSMGGSELRFGRLSDCLIPPTSVAMRFVCDNAASAVEIPGVNV
jgi:hypothetical protein